MSETIQFLLNNELRELRDIAPTTTILNYLRRNERLTGTKEGCAEGDCGACTLILAEPSDTGLVYRPINSCIQFVPALHGRQLISVEHLSDGRGDLHPVQQALVDLHASQCGFCTPGFVMQIYAGWRTGKFSSRQDIKDWIAGNLCRCTGYGPIVDAAETMRAVAVEADPSEQDIADQLRALAGSTMLNYASGDQVWMAPRTIDELASVYAEHPDATLIAGATDVGLWVTKQHRTLHHLIDVTRIPDLQTIETRNGEIRIGAAVSHQDAFETLAAIHPDIGEVMRRFAAVQIRTAGTVGGNIANGSPIGDLPPILIALGARLVLRNGQKSREIALENFFVDYGRQDRAPGEFVETIIIPELAANVMFSCHKISKRFDQDISALLAAFAVTLDGAKVTDAKLAFGGMAGIPKRAMAGEDVLKGASWDRDSIESACHAFTADFTPMTDMRASADYRMLAAQNCLRRFYLENAPDGLKRPSRILELADG